MFPQNLEDQTLEAMWGHYKSALDFTVREVLGKCLCAKNLRISQATLAIIDLKERCRGIQMPGRATEKITAA